MNEEGMNEEFAGELSGEAALERVADIARELADSDSLDETLQQVVDLAVGYIDHCDGATLMFVGDGGKVSTPAWTSPEVRDSDLAQYETGEGPCLHSMREHETVVIDDLETEERWPEWRGAISDLGWRSMVGLRLFLAENTMGALNLYSRQPRGFDPHAQVPGRVFASHAAVAMKAAIGDQGLRRALESRDIIGQAKGVLMERERLSGQQAFDRLRELSNRRNVKLRDLAQDIAETGDVPE
ncbi:MAG: GAF and ANTAR domain-containing protein [Nitriliruptorales bacterium]|nr:GAF and ANTAR domain-containing protein [Nitriliruptorales bacterium]